MAKEKTRAELQKRIDELESVLNQPKAEAPVETTPRQQALMRLQLASDRLESLQSELTNYERAARSLRTQIEKGRIDLNAAQTEVSYSATV